MAGRQRAVCPGCGRSVSASMVDPMAGPLAIRKHNSAPGVRCVNPATGRDWRIRP